VKPCPHPTEDRTASARTTETAVSDYIRSVPGSLDMKRGKKMPPFIIRKGLLGAKKVLILINKIRHFLTPFFV
jgi:hypothetical protein